MRGGSSGSTSQRRAGQASGRLAGSHQIDCIRATPSTRPGRRRSGTGLDRDPLERLGVLVAAPLPHLAMALAHELLEVPLAPGFGNLALVLAQGGDLLVQRRADVDEVVARGPERDPNLFHLVRLVTLLEQAAKRTRVARVWVDRRHRGFTDGEMVWM